MSSWKSHGPWGHCIVLVCSLIGRRRNILNRLNFFFQSSHKNVIAPDLPKKKSKLACVSPSCGIRRGGGWKRWKQQGNKNQISASLLSSCISFAKCVPSHMARLSPLPPGAVRRVWKELLMEPASVGSKSSTRLMDPAKLWILEHSGSSIWEFYWLQVRLIMTAMN